MKDLFDTTVSKPLLSVKRHACGAPGWRLDTGLIGVGEAAWCPDRARLRFGGARAFLVSERDLEQQLERARRVKAPDWLLFAPHEDAFTPHALPERRDELVRMMKRLLDSGIALTLTTRGDVVSGQGLVTLAKQYGRGLSVRVGVFSTESRVEEKWERGLPTAARRLALARLLSESGARVEVELGPIVPFANDDVRQLKDSMRAIARSGLGVVAPRWIEDAPGLERQIEAEVSPSTARLVTGWFRQPGSNMGGASRRILPLQVRKSRLEHLEEAANHLGVQLLACGCSDAGACVSCHVGEPIRVRASQLELFGRQA